MLCTPRHQRLVEEIAQNPYLAAEDLSEADRFVEELHQRSRICDRGFDRWKTLADRFEAMLAYIANERR